MTTLSKERSSSPPLVFVSPSATRRRELMLRKQQSRLQNDSGEEIAGRGVDPSISVGERIKEFNSRTSVKGTPTSKCQLTGSFDYSEKNQQRNIRCAESNEDSSSSVVSLGSVSALTLNASMLSLGFGAADSSSVATTKKYQSSSSSYFPNPSTNFNPGNDTFNKRTPDRLSMPMRHAGNLTSSPTISVHTKYNSQVKCALRETTANNNNLLENVVAEVNPLKETMRLPTRDKLNTMSTSLNASPLITKTTLPKSASVEPYPRCISFLPPSSTTTTDAVGHYNANAASMSKSNRENLPKVQRLNIPSPSTRSVIPSNEESACNMSPFLTGESHSREVESDDSVKMTVADRARLFGEVVSPRKTPIKQKTPSPFPEPSKTPEQRLSRLEKLNKAHIFAEQEEVHVSKGKLEWVVEESSESIIAGSEQGQHHFSRGEEAKDIPDCMEALPLVEDIELERKLESAHFEGNYPTRQKVAEICPDTQTPAVESQVMRNGVQIFTSNERSLFEQQPQRHNLAIEKHNFQEALEHESSDVNNDDTSPGATCFSATTDFQNRLSIEEPPQEMHKSSLPSDFNSDQQICISCVNDLNAIDQQNLMDEGYTNSSCLSQVSDVVGSYIVSITSASFQEESSCSVTVLPDDINGSGFAKGSKEEKEILESREAPDCFAGQEQTRIEVNPSSPLVSEWGDSGWAFDERAFSLASREQVDTDNVHDFVGDLAESAELLFGKDQFSFESKNQREINLYQDILTSSWEASKVIADQASSETCEKSSPINEKNLSAELFPTAEKYRAGCTSVSVCKFELTTGDRIKKVKKISKCINCQCLQLQMQQVSGQPCQFIGVGKPSLSDEDTVIESSTELLLSPSKKESKSKMKKAASLIRSNLWFSPPKGAKTLVKFISNNAISTTLLCHNISEKSKEQPKVSQGDIKYLNRSDMSSESSFNTIFQMQNTKFLPDQYIESNSFDDDDSRKLIQLDKIPKSYATALQYDGFEGGAENFGAEELSVLSRVRTNSTSKEPGSQGSTRSI